MSKSISLFGLGYVGSVSAACFAELGHKILGVDVSRDKVDMLGAGKSPIVETGVGVRLAKAHAAGLLHATTDAVTAVMQTEVSFVCVGTPSLRSGKLDLSHIEHVSGEIGAALREKQTAHTVILRSTMLPGTTEAIVIPILERASEKKAGRDFNVIYNPEFMREGSAVADFLQPPYTVLGAQDPGHLSTAKELYKDVSCKTFETSIPVAEMVKYVSNLFHAVKVGFANEIGTLCKNLGLDTQVITQIFTSDTKLNISPAYLSPGFAFGGSCLPKDLRAIAYKAKELDLDLPLIQALMPSNAQHIERAIEAVLHTGKRKICLLGLSFKSGTDDLRESPQVHLVKRLLGEGCQVIIWDEDVSLGRLAGANRKYIEEVIPHISSLLTTNLEAAVRSAEVVIIGTRAVASAQVSALLDKNQIVIDLVNLDSARRPQSQATYQGICW